MDENEENHSSTGQLRTHFIKALPNSSASPMFFIHNSKIPSHCATIDLDLYEKSIFFIL